MRWLIFIHRWAGIAIGWLLVVWCVSGIVMMYVAYPDVSRREMHELLPAIELSPDCCALRQAAESLAGSVIPDFSLEMLGDTPVLRIRGEFGRSWTLNLETGAPLEPIDGDEALTVAERLAAASGFRGHFEYLGENLRDQWTVSGFFDPHRPLHHLALDDSRRTQWYISSSSGELVQATTRAERAWNWVGAVPHWTYPTILRQNGALWIQVIIWTTLIGTFLTVVGLYLGIARLRRRRNGRWSPYRGVTLWHHYMGLVFGVLALGWIVSGLLSVNPWGLLEGSGARRESQDIRGALLGWEDVQSFIEQAAATGNPDGFVRMQSAPFAGGAYVIAYTRDDGARRLSMENLATTPLSEAELIDVVPDLLGGSKASSSELIDEGDAYYFSHHIEREFPVFRVVADDRERTRYYLSATTGQLLRKADPGRRWYRWLFEGLHRFDFNDAMRRRPLWDILMIVLLAGVTGICATGTYMGYRYLAGKIGPPMSAKRQHG